MLNGDTAPGPPRHITMDFRALRIFTTTAELGSLSRAAAALGVAQSMLSRQISALESELQLRLFHRTGRGVALTEAGAGLLPRAMALLADAQQFVHEAHDAAGTPRGVVAVAMVPSLTQPLAADLWRALSPRYPGITLRLLEGYSGAVEDWLASGRADLGLFNRYRARARQAQALLKSELHLVLPARDARSSMGSIRFAELAGVPLAMTVRPNALRNHLDELCQRLGVALNVQVEADSSVVLKDLVRRGGLATLLPPHGLAMERAQGLLGSVRIVEPVVAQSTWLEATHHHPLSAAARVVMGELVRLVQRLRA